MPDEPVPLRTDGPHSPDYMRQVAGTFAEATMATDAVADLREAARLMRERAQSARDLTEDGNGRWFPWGVIQRTAWRDWPEPRPVPVPFAFDGSTEMATGAHEPTGEAFVAHARYAHDQEEDWHESEFIAGPMPEPVAAFMAGMHPGVALAVADWLDRFADPVYCYGPAEFDHALAIARTYLGTPAEEGE